MKAKIKYLLQLNNETGFSKYVFTYDVKAILVYDF